MNIASLLLDILIPLLSWGYTCLILLVTKTLRRGALSALSFCNVEIFLVMFISDVDFDKAKMFFFLAFTVYLLMVGLIFLLRPSLIRLAPASYSIYLVANSLVTPYIIGTLFGYNMERLGALAAFLFVTAVAWGIRLRMVEYVRAVRRRIRERHGAPQMAFIPP